MSLDDVSLEKIPFSTMSHQELMDVFKKYKFTDEIGHDLLFCKDFLDLINGFVWLKNYIINKE